MVDDREAEVDFIPRVHFAIYEVLLNDACKKKPTRKGRQSCFFGGSNQRHLESVELVVDVVEATNAAVDEERGRLGGVGDLPHVLVDAAERLVVAEGGSAVVDAPILVLDVRRVVRVLLNRIR